MDTTIMYHRDTVMPLQVVAFAYVIPSASGGKGYIICINLVLPMGWVNSPIILCAFLEILIDVTNSLVDTDLLVLSYSKISDIPETRPGPLHTPHILTHINFCMYDVISEVHGDLYFQHRVFDGTVCAPKLLFPSLQGYLKDSVWVNDILAV